MIQTLWSLTMTKTLTEQWRERTLPEGLYYVEGKGNYDIALIRNRYCPVLTSPYCEDNAFESEFVPVAPVPSYDEVKEMSQKIERLEFDNEALEMAHNEGKEINAELVSKTYKLEKQLEIATKALKSFIPDDLTDGGFGEMYESVIFYCEKALKEMEGVK
jgi:hypothetical protein